MSTTFEFLTQLRSQGIHITAIDSQLKVKAPPGILTNAIKVELKSRKDELISFLDKATRSASCRTPIKRIARGGELPLSFAQKRLWILEQIEGESSTYNIFRAFWLWGKLDVAVLERCLNEIVCRHEMLRTRFTAVNGHPRQIIMPFQPFQLPVTNVQSLAEAEQETAVERLRREACERPFNINGDLLLRSHLIQLDDEEFVFFLNMHHIAADGWSNSIINRELFELYQAFIENKPFPLPELSIQYADFAAWQQTALGTETLEAQLAYWQKQLGGSLPVLELPTDFARPLQQSHRGAQEIVTIPKELVEAVKKLSAQRGMTLFMTMLAVFKLLLYRYTGQEDVIVGSPIAGREKAELEPLIGCFLNTLVLRTDLSGSPTFNQVLENVHRVCVDAYSNQDIPFEKLLEVLQPDRDLSRTPLFQVFFNMLNFDDATSNQFLPGITSQFIKNPQMESKFDMTLYVENYYDEIALTLVYSPDLFTSERIAEMLSQYLHLLEQLVANPGQKIAEPSLVTEAARQFLPNLVEPLGETWHGPVHEMVSKQAQSLPEHLAVVDAQESLRYSELERLSNQLAHQLLDANIKPQDVVAVYAHRSSSLVVALMGIMKAGATFVILDPAYPPQRLIDYVDPVNPSGFIQLDVAGPVPPALDDWLAGHELACRIQLPRPGELVAKGMLANYAVTPPEVTVGPNDLAYIAFTSGSTGKPKAIMGRHGSLSHFLPWQQQAFRLTTDDRFSMLSGLSHDPLQRDIFTSLWVGATLYIPEPDFVGNSRRFANWMADCGITFAHMTPPMNAILTETAVSDIRLPSLKYTFFVGDKVTKDDVNRLRKLAPQVTCINSYGSTETQRAVGYNLIPPDVSLETARAILPVGRGMPDVQLMILNEHGQQTGIGELGEIHVRSPHLSGGYLNEPEMTAERFPANPCTDRPQDKMYRSGDLGRYLPDGTVEFVGRNDRQVKIRGFRIELGEIESALTQHPAVEKGVVVLHSNGQQLIAYAVSPQNQDDEFADSIRASLMNRLPNFMVPSSVTVLDSLPLTPNGKIDYRALPEPELDAHAETYVPPQTELEKQLVTMWEDGLSVEKVGIQDNFFALGGHSLLAVRLFTQIESKFDVNLPLLTLFQGGTVAHLAQQIEKQQGKTRWSSIVKMQMDGKKRPFFCVHGITGDLLWFRELAGLFAPERPFIGLRSHGLDGVQEPFETIAGMAAHYISEMRQVQPVGPYYIGGASFGGTVALEMAQQLKERGDDVALLVMFDHAPHNAEFGEQRKRETAVSFIKNFPLWAKSFAELGPKRMFARMRRQIRVLLHQGSAKLKHNQPPIGEITADDLLDYASELPQHRRTLIEKNFYAMKAYIPLQYDGPVLVIKAKARSLFRVIDPVEGWKHLSNGDLLVQTIPGSHEGIFKSPNVQELAKQLQTCLDEA